jgi:type I restriction enzyme R subunit
MSKIHHESELERHVVEQLHAAGWLVGTSAAYDRARALYPEDVIGWLRDSQPEAWDKLLRLHGGAADVAGAALLDRLVKTLETAEAGTLTVLRRGLALAGAGQMAMSEALPEDARNETSTRRYAANRLRVVPQVTYSLDNTDRIDLVFFLNGLPVATVELKTDFTQSVEAAVLQYRNDRSPKNPKTGKAEPLLTFKRGAIVHFAMSDSDIRMATKLAGAATFFLPFNRGNDGAAGNPAGDAGTYPVAYLWQRVLQKDAWLRVFHRFVLLERKEEQDVNGRTTHKEALIFPRFHQWEGVSHLVQAVRSEGVGQPYLVQHSAGSGKTHTISWTAHELIRIRRPDGEPYFHSVVVVTDRTVLDRQLQDAIAQIEHQRGVVVAIDREASSLPKSQQLAQAMLAGTPIIICTLQTFPHAQKAILTEQSLRARRFAIVIDEAHSSTSGGTADDLRYVLTGQSEAEWEQLSAQERLSVWQSARQRPGNASYFAFTATPKHSTLSLFGRPRDAAQPVSKGNPPTPFHTYTMQQAIEEDFILDVLRNYTHYSVALRIGSAFTAGEDKRVDSKAARRKLAKWLSLHPTNIAQKVALIVEHFRATVAPLLNRQAKAMVVTGSRAAAVKYHLELQRYCQQAGYADVHAMVAFSGDVPNQEVNNPEHVPEHAFNETNLNPGLHGREMRKAFDTQDYQVMIVANKFQTGFDQPKLVAMYLDKKVSGVEAVQTLSRLNRKHAGKDKTYVIDFANEPNEIEAAFKTFYRDAQVADIQDANVVYDLKASLDAMLLYETDEVRRFAEAIVDDQVTHQNLYHLTQAPTDRFNAQLKALTDAIARWEAAWRSANDANDTAGMAHAEAQRLELSTQRDKLIVFREGLGKFVRTYEYVGQLVDFADPPLEGLAAFARLLHKRLNGIPTEQVDLGDLKLTHYKLRRDGGLEGIRKGGESPLLYPITDNGLREARDRETTYLSELIDKLNQALGKDVSDADQVALAVHVSEKLRGDAVLMAQVQNNPKDQAMRANLPAAAVQALFGAMTAHQKSVTHLLSDEESRRLFVDVVYELLMADRAAALLQRGRAVGG